MEIGRKIYYDSTTGNSLVDTGERNGNVIETTQDQDFKTYKALVDRVPKTVGLIELEYGEYREDFVTCNGYRINLKTKKIEFSYPNPNEPEKPQEPVYQKPLSEQITDLKSENALLKAQVKAAADRADFIEDVISELATQLYK